MESSKIEYKKVDFTAPRYRPKVHQVLSQEMIKDFKKKYPQYSSRSYKELRDIIITFNGLIQDTVINTRDGVDLPESLGRLNVISCKFTGRNNTNHKYSAMHEQKLTHTNTHTDNLLAKILYTNYPNKYLFAYKKLWLFVGCRNFKRTVAKTFPENFKMYIELDPYQKLFNKKRNLGKSIDVEEKVFESDLAAYNEFKMD